MGPLGSDAAAALAVPATDTSQQRQKFRQADEDGKIVCCPRIPTAHVPAHVTLSLRKGSVFMRRSSHDRLCNSSTIAFLDLYIMRRLRRCMLENGHYEAGRSE